MDEGRVLQVTVIGIYALRIMVKDDSLYRLLYYCSILSL